MLIRYAPTIPHIKRKYTLLSPLLQVSNQTSCIKIATDFVTVDCVTETEVVTSEFRDEELVDVVRLSTAIWQGWQSLQQLSQMPQSARPRTRALGGTKAKSQPQKQPTNQGAQPAPHNPLLHFSCPDPGCYRKNRLYTAESLYSHM